jgi:hypothetical protein
MKLTRAIEGKSGQPKRCRVSREGNRFRHGGNKYRIRSESCWHSKNSVGRKGKISWSAGNRPDTRLICGLLLPFHQSDFERVDLGPADPSFYCRIVVKNLPGLFR